MFPQQNGAQPKQFNPLKTLKTLFYIAMIVILFSGCFKTGNYLFGTDSEIAGAVSRGANAAWTNITSFSQALDVSWLHGLFVWPVTRLLAGVFAGTGNAILTIIVATLVIRGIGTLLSIKATIQLEKLKEVQPKMAAIQAKYAGRTDSASKQQMGQEIWALYKKEGVNPVASIGTMFVSMPLFIALWRAIMASSSLYGIELFNGNMVANAEPLTQITKHFTDGGWLYLFPIILMAAGQYLSIMLPQKLSASRSKGPVNPKASSQSRKTANIMVIIMIVMAINLPVLMVFYWIFSSMYTMAQAFIIHKYFESKRKK